jgi:hypothetical protein
MKHETPKHETPKHETPKHETPKQVTHKQTLTRQFHDSMFNVSIVLFFFFKMAALFSPALQQKSFAVKLQYLSIFYVNVCLNYLKPAIVMFGRYHPVKVTTNVPAG